MRRNVSEEVMNLEDIISKAYTLLSQNKRSRRTIKERA